jgi:hypothetical protein
MAFPGSKVHRASRRKLGRGQHTQYPIATCAVTSNASTVTLTFSQAVVVSGTIRVTISGGVTVTAQVVTSTTVVTLTCSGAVAAKTYAIDFTGVVATYQGGGIAPVSGTF